MPPAARNFYVIIFDLKTQSRASSLKALSTILLYKQLSTSKDQFKLYLVNTARSSDSLPEGMFLFNANTNVETLLTELEAFETGNSDWLEALNTAVRDLKEWFDEPGIISLQVLFITDLSSFERPNNGKLLESVTNDIKEYNMFLYVVGPNIEPPNIILSGGDIKEWMQSLTVDKNNSNLKIMKKIINKTPHSVMCSYNVGVHLFNSFQNKKGMQPWLVPLTCGTTLNFDVSTQRITKRDAPIKLKATSRKSRYVYRWVYEDQEDVDYVDPTIPGIVKHGKFVKIETDDMFKIDGPRSFLVLGFTSATNIPEYLCQSEGSYLVVPQPDHQGQTTFFSALVDELKESNKCIIARRVYNKNSNPKFVVLIPNTNFHINCFTLCELPYADDMAHSYKEQDVSTAPRVEKNQDACDFLDSINVSNKNCQIKVPLSPVMMVHTSSLDIIKKVEEKKAIEDAFLDKKFTHSGEDLQNLVLDLKTTWPVRELLKAKKEENITDDFDEIEDFNFS